MKEFDYRSLDRKLRRGKPLAIAAEESGIPLDAAKCWLHEHKRYEPAMLRASIEIAASDALEVAMDTLRSLASDENIEPATRQRAATNLCRLALQIATSSQPAEPPGPEDLFDKSDRGPWKPYAEK